MATHLKTREYYEDLYDRQTVEIGRREAGSFLRAREEFYLKVQVKDQKEKDVLDFWWTRLYWWMVEVPVLVERWENKKITVDQWMIRDRESDMRLERARPSIEPICSHCGGQGLRLKLKELIHRSGDNYQSVLFMFDCGKCKKRCAFWEDGTEWESPATPCPKCNADLVMDVEVRGTIMTTIHTCQACDYKEVEKVHMNRKEKKDPDYEHHKKLFCLTDERGTLMQAYRHKWQEACRMMDEEMERDSKKEMYDVVSKLNLLKVVDLIDTLQSPIEAAGFIELRFEKPDIGREFSVEFSCLDKDSSRSDAKSRAALKKAVTSTLADTNWRLMSDGISYRLGYLSGRVRVYESEKDLADLIERERKR
ncbi:hypothetical protein E6P97_01010 [Patescibacteria group bacterium]|nr:MAG: hypothetical protein E6P97_01010 [Patescibacteria group bacterium]